MNTPMTSVLIPPSATASSAAPLFSRGHRIHSITLNTLLCFAATLAAVTAVVSLDTHHLDTDVLFLSFSVAGLFAVALTEGRGPARQARSERLARFPSLAASTKSPEPQTSKVAA
jgi:hypothetical protein